MITNDSLSSIEKLHIEFLDKFSNYEIEEHQHNKNNFVIIKGKKVEATDLRAGACLVLAGLLAEGTTIVNNVEHVLRGYEDIIEKLTDVGAKIELLED